MDRFRRTARLVPLALALHVAEEAPGFAAWARRHASRDYSDADFVRINAYGLAGSLAASEAVARGVGGRRLLLVFYTAVLTQQALWNPVFHVGTTVAWREYSPGLVTSVALFPPLWATLTRRGFRTGLLTPRRLAVSVATAGAIHAAAVARQVFRWPA